MKRITFLLSTLFLLAALLSLKAQNPAPLEITYIANEGFLIASGNDKILIDALQRGSIPGYAVPSPELLQQMEYAKGPFEGVDLVLASHRHWDHFDAGAVARHLQFNREAKFISTSELVGAVRREPIRDHVPPRIIEAPYLDPPGRSRHSRGTIGLEILRLNHTGYPRKHLRLQNLGNLMTIGGKKILHIGDAAMNAENYSSHKLTEDNIDILFVPYWFLTDKQGRRVVTELIRPAQVIAMHIPPEELPEIAKKIRAAFPRAVIFTRQGETKTF